MANHLTAQLFASHGAEWPRAAGPVRVRADQVLLDEQGGLVTLLAFESLGRARHSAEVALVAPAREAEGPDALADLGFLQGAAAAFGATFVRPGAGPPAAIHRRGFARPGRSLLSSVSGASGAGAFAMLVLSAEPTECAAALAGEPLLRERPPVLGVRLVGAPAPGVGAAEILATLARALERADGFILEFHGESVARIGMADRVGIAMLAGAFLGASGVVFPSDETTRARLGALGRDADWRRVEGGSEGFERTIDFDLSRARARRVETARVRVGPFAEDDDVAALATAGAAGASLAGWEVVPGGRAARAALEEGGALAALAAAGAAIVDAGEPRALAASAADALTLGEDPDLVSDRARHVSAASLLWSLGVGQAGAVVGKCPLGPAEWIDPPAAGAAEVRDRDVSHPVPTPGLALEGSPRGPVLWASERDVPADRVLAWGPRAQASRADATALATFAFRSGEDAEEIRPCAWGFAVSAGRWGAGGPHEPAARSMAALGIRAVIAASFEPAHAHALAMQGVLPLAWTRPADAAAVSRGDELELPGIVEALARQGRITVRGLTRGISFHVLPALGAEWLAIVRSGGLLGAIARANPIEAG